MLWNTGRALARQVGCVAECKEIVLQMCQCEMNHELERIRNEMSAYFFFLLLGNINSPVKL